jgi:hypothetical protein
MLPLAYPKRETVEAWLERFISGPLGAYSYRALA